MSEKEVKFNNFDDEFFKGLIAISGALKGLKPSQSTEIICPICGNKLFVQKFKKGHVAQCQTLNCLKSMS